MKYYIGMDGGGTKTAVLIGSDNKEIIDRFYLGALNFNSVGREAVKDTLSVMFDKLKSYHGISIDEITKICAGVAGVNNSYDEKIMHELFNSAGYKNDLIVCNDAVSGLVGANGVMDGGLLICGTGSQAFGIAKDGSRVRVGGWGHIIGDEGSAYAIGRDAIAVIMEAYDGRRPATKIWDNVRDKLKINIHEELVTFAYDPKTKKHHIADLAPCVLDLFGTDQGADYIIEKAIDSLYKMIKALAERMDRKEFSLGLIGSIVVKSDIIRGLLKNAVNAEFPGIDIHLPYHEPDYGALLMAWN